MHRLLLIAFLAPITVLAAPTDSLAGFDYDKAKQLSEERRQQYDVVFFNEVAIWQYNSNRYLSQAQATSSRKEQTRGAGTSYQKRFEEFRAMANDGYMPAYAALRLLNIRGGGQLDDPAALDLLIDYAESGDLSSMCALRAIQLTTVIADKAPRYAEAAARLTEEGAKRGHPACLLTKAMMQIRYVGDWRAVIDLEELKPYLLPGAEQGYYRAHQTFYRARAQAADFELFDFDNRQDLLRTLCWGRLAQQHTNWAMFDAFLGKLRRYATSHDRPDLKQLASQYDQEIVPITTHVVEPKDCIRLETSE
jgi:hypothetical protein